MTNSNDDKLITIDNLPKYLLGKYFVPGTYSAESDPWYVEDDEEDTEDCDICD